MLLNVIAIRRMMVAPDLENEVIREKERFGTAISNFEAGLKKKLR